MTDTSDNRSPEYFDGMADKVQRANYPYEIEQVFRAAADLARLLANTEESLATMHAQYKDASMRAEAAESRESELREKARVLRESLTEIEREAQKIPGNMGNVIDDTIRPRMQAYLRQWIVSCAKKALAATADEPKMKEERT